MMKLEELANQQQHALRASLAAPQRASALNAPPNPGSFAAASPRWDVSPVSNKSAGQEARSIAPGEDSLQVSTRTLLHAPHFNGTASACEQNRSALTVSPRSLLAGYGRVPECRRCEFRSGIHARAAERRRKQHSAAARSTQRDPAAWAARV